MSDITAAAVVVVLLEVVRLTASDPFHPGTGKYM
jgi:hypothetical protein